MTGQARRWLHKSPLLRVGCGATLGDIAYVNELRIRNACRALLEGEQSVAEIAYASGFNSLSHFNTQFRRLERTTPTDFREKARKGVSHQNLHSPADWLGAFR